MSNNEIAPNGKIGALKKLKGSLLIVLLLLGYLIIRCNYLDTVPRWDAASYWGALMQSVHSTQTVGSIANFPSMVLREWNAFGHPSMGYYSLLVMGQLIDFP